VGGVGADLAVSVIGRGARIEGALVSEGSVRIDGWVRGTITAQGEVSMSSQSRVEADIRAHALTVAGHLRGDITAVGDLVLPADSRVEGEIHARNVSVGGAVRGDIAAEGRVELGSGAHVEGDITSTTLVVAPGAVFSGCSIMESAGGATVPGRGKRE
jgi:cytoskeletal protein CcmA (bactofilin family)